ncbi:MAG: hypothetical protein KIT33_08485 [Candidatus Kapabacteria bacterium]|nr:hypothetical protein [Ignavibacteriota bacterium]MCW5884992.1 hypothetical protein [Candidatus Kapabacteria bacterium]
MNKSAVICEFGNSHDELLYSQFEFLKMSGYTTHFIGNESLKSRFDFYDNIDNYYFLNFSGNQLSKFYQIVKTWQYIRKFDIQNIILNTIEGTPVRNFCLFPFGKRKVSGIIHNAGNLKSSSKTFQKIIIPKIKKMFTLNPYIWKNSGSELDIKNEYIYPIARPKFLAERIKPDNEFWIIIPGLVEAERRDYFLLLETLKNKSVPKEIKFILLGKSMHNKGIGSELKIKIAEYNLENNFILFDDYVDNSTFRNYMSNGDILATLIHPGAGNFRSYSSTKTSGTFLMSFSYMIPMLNHEYFENFEDINISSIFYNSDNFYEKIISLKENPQILKLIKSQMVNHNKFDFEVNRQKYIKLVEY